MKLLKNIFTGILITVFATTNALAEDTNCANETYRRAHPIKCSASNNSTLLSVVGGAALIGAGFALTAQASGGNKTPSAVNSVPRNTTPRIVLSKNVNEDYNPWDNVNNRRISSTTYNFTASTDISSSVINEIKNTEKYQQNKQQYNAINFTASVARGFSGQNSNIAVLDDFYVSHGNTVYEIAKKVAPGANVTKVNLTSQANIFEQFDVMANIMQNVAPANIYNSSWQMNSVPTNNAATAIYNQNSVKTYADAQSYMYNITSENFINQIRNTAADNDAIFVWAAGNDGQSESGALSAMPLAFPDLQGHFVNVVAVNNVGHIAEYSNQCGITQNYCIAAPGSRWKTDNNERVSGTSFAAPVVSAAIATIKEAFPYMEATEITQLLFTTATDLGEPGVDAVFGWGLLNMDAATQPVGTPRIVLSNETIQPLDTISVSAPVANAIRNANVQIAFVDDFGRAFTTNLGDNIKVIPYGRGFDKLREQENDALVLFDNMEFGLKQNHLLESYGVMSVKSDNLTNFVGYKNEFNINGINLYGNIRLGSTNPLPDDNSIVSGFSNIYTTSVKTGAKWNDFAIEVALPETIIAGDMYINIPTGRANNGDMKYATVGVDLATRPSVEYTMKYKNLSATFVDNHDFPDEFFFIAKTKFAF